MIEFNFSFLVVLQMVVKQNNEIQCIVEFSSDRKHVKISGRINEKVKDRKLTFTAVAPCDRRTSFSGSGLPFPSLQMGLEGSPNIGSIILSEHNTFSLEMQVPCSYYIGLGTLLMPPTVHFSWNNGYVTKNRNIELCESIPYRSLTYPGLRKNATFYSTFATLPVRGQEDIIQSGAYPYDTMREANKFWGLRPPV
jgi:hypothetical protein